MVGCRQRSPKRRWPPATAWRDEHGPGTYPAIIVIQEIFGVNDHIRDLTARIAKQGYVAIAPAMYQRQASGFETANSSARRPN